MKKALLIRCREYFLLKKHFIRQILILIYRYMNEIRDNSYKNPSRQFVLNHINRDIWKNVFAFTLIFAKIKQHPPPIIAKKKKNCVFEVSIFLFYDTYILYNITENPWKNMTFLFQIKQGYLKCIGVYIDFWHFPPKQIAKKIKSVLWV